MKQERIEYAMIVVRSAIAPDTIVALNTCSFARVVSKKYVSEKLAPGPAVAAMELCSISPTVGARGGLEDQMMKEPSTYTRRLLHCLCGQRAASRWRNPIGNLIPDHDGYHGTESRIQDVLRVCRCYVVPSAHSTFEESKTVLHQEHDGCCQKGPRVLLSYPFMVRSILQLRNHIVQDGKPLLQRIQIKRNLSSGRAHLRVSLC